MTMKWCEDKEAERQLTAIGLSWKTETVPLKSIDVRGGLKHSARTVANGSAIDEQFVERYALEMERGAEFPRVVLCKEKNGQMLPLGGNHRIAAADLCGANSIDAYVVNRADTEIQNLSPSILNGAHGIPTKPAESLQNAIISILKYNWTPEKACELHKVKRDRLMKALRANRVREALAKESLNASSMPAETLLVLDGIKSDNVLCQAARIVISGKMTADDTKNLIVKPIAAVRTSELDQLAKLSEINKQLGTDSKESKIVAATRGKGRIPASEAQIRLFFLRHFRALSECLNGKRKLEQCGIIEASERAALQPKLKALSEKLFALSK